MLRRRLEVPIKEPSNSPLLPKISSTPEIGSTVSVLQTPSSAGAIVLSSTPSEWRAGFGKAFHARMAWRLATIASKLGRSEGV